MTSCSTNQPCSQGQCCEVSILSHKRNTCTTVPSICYTGDGTFDEGESCSQNSQCATDCCDRFSDVCNATGGTTSCMSNGLAGWIIALIVIFSVLFVIIIIVCICCCVRAQRRHKPHRQAPPTSMTVISAQHNMQPNPQEFKASMPYQAPQQQQAYMPQPVVEYTAQPINANVDGKIELSGNQR